MDQSTPTSAVDSSSQSPPVGEKKIPGIRVKFKDSSLKFNPDYHEESLQDKIALIFSNEEVVKDISFSEDKSYAYIELQDPKDIEQLMKYNITLGKKQPPLVKEEIDLMEVKMPYLKISGLEEWMFESTDIIKDHFEEEASGEVQSVVPCSEPGTAIVKFMDPKVCLILDQKTELMGTEIAVQVEYEIPTATVEENLVLVMKPLPAKVPERVIPNQLKKYFEKHYSKSPVECKIISKTAYLMFENSAVVKHIISNPPDHSFSPGIKISSMPASEAMPNEEQTHEESEPSISETSTDGHTDLCSSKHPKQIEQKITEATNSEDLAVRASDLGLSTTESSISSSVNNTPGKSIENESLQLQQSLCTTSSPMLSIKPSSDSPQLDHNHSFSSLSESEGNEESSLSNTNMYPKTEQSTTKVLIDDIPSVKRDASLIEKYMSSLMKLPCSVKQYGKLFMATFEQAIDCNQLKMRGMKNTFGGVKLSFYHLGPTDTILVGHIADLPEPEGYLKFHFERFTGPSSISSVKFISESKALIKFCKCESVQQALSAECTKLGTLTLTVSEHYDSISVEDDEESKPLLPSQEPEKRIWKPIKFEVKSLEALWLEGILNDLNNKLEKLSARAHMNKEQSSMYLEIVPLEASSSHDNWPTNVENIFTETRKAFVEVSLQIPVSLKSEILQLAQNVSGPTLHVRLRNSTLVIGGHQKQVKKLEDDIKQQITELHIEKEEKKFPKQLVHCIRHFFEQKLSFPGVEKSILSPEHGKIVVFGNQKGRQEFWKCITGNIQLVHEKSCLISKPMFDLLKSDKGAKKINELLGLSKDNIVYYLDETAGNCTIYFMSFTVQKEILKKSKNDFKKYFDEHSIDITRPQICGCGDTRWKGFVKKLECDHLVAIAVDASIPSITVVGEKIVISDICTKIKNFLLDIVSIEDELTLSYHEWKVISSHSMQKLDAIKKDIKGITILTPTKGYVRGLQVTITIRGDPAAVENAKTRLKTLQAEVFYKEDKMHNVPAARQLINRMHDKIQLMETTMHSSIDISVIREKSTPSAKSDKKVASQPQNVCFATLKNETRIIVYQGDFTKHEHAVDTTINFVSVSPSDSDANLKELKAIPSGSRLFDQFMTMMNYTKPRAGQIMKAENPGELKCSHLWHVLLEPWSGGKKNEAFFLGKFLEKIFQEAKGSRTILLTTTCGNSLNYPADVFAKMIIQSMKLQPPSPDLMVIVYIEKQSDATEFVKQFGDPNNECRLLKQEVVQSPAIKKQEIKMQPTNRQPFKGKIANVAIEHAEFIKVEKGDMTKTKADVLVNSTNSDLNLSNGMVSKILLKKCGQDLQEECSKLAPLLPGKVAITSAKNLSCKFIYHVVLRSSSEKDAEEGFRQSIQEVLRKSQEQKVGSIAFPSLGVGNLNYSPKISAQIICEQIIAFRILNPQSTTKHHLVIFDSKVFEEFKKTVDDIMTGGIDILSPGSAELSRSQTISSLTPSQSSGNIILTIENSDISDEACDVIVNTTTEKISSKDTAVAKAILTKGGPNLQHQCSDFVKKGNLLGYGDIKMMNVQGFGKLKCKKLIHTHLCSKEKNGYDNIHQIVTNCIKEAERARMKSIALPAFGLGTGGYTVQEVAEPMFVALTEFGLSNLKSINTIKIVINDPLKYKEFYNQYMSFFKLDSPGILSAVYSFVVSPFSSKGQTTAVDLSSLDPSILDNLGNSLVLFRVYAPSTNICEEIIQKLVDYIKDQCMDEPLQNPIIKHLLPVVKKEIQKVGHSSKVHIEIFEDIDTINIIGEKSDVINARVDISEILAEAGRVHAALEKYQWKTIDDDDIEPYSHEDSYILENAYMKKKSTVKLIIHNMECDINLDTFEERSTGKVRKIKREEKLQHSVPPSWTSQQGVHIIDVPSTDTEYGDALQEFNKTIGRKVSIVNLKRIENHRVYIQHKSFLEAVKQKYPHKDSIITKRLFHGSRETSIAPILNQGFNRNFAADANAAVYGCGVYFALNASYSANDFYSVPNSDGIKQMFICSMIIGEYTVGNGKMKVAPPLATGSDLLFDTLVDKQDKPTIFVALTDGQAYPEYLVSFKLV